MNGFLQRLALRESGLAPLISPRMPSWFEPVHAAPARVAGSEAEEEGAAAPRDTAAHVTARPAPAGGLPDVIAPTMTKTAPAAPSRPAAPARAAHTAERQVEPVSASLVPSLQPVRREAPAPAATTRVSAPPASLLAAAVQNKAPAAPSAPQAAVPQAAVPQAAVGATAAAHRQPAVPVPARLSVERDRSAQRRPALQPSPARMAPAALLAARADGARKAEPAAPAEQIVQVTIGRLEVRAVQATQAPAAAQRPRQSPTSLDDYLAKRNGEVKR